MIRRNIDPSTWAMIHDLELGKDYCRKCGKEVHVNIPIESDDFVGFESESHEPCGTGYKIILLKSLDLDVIEMVKSIFRKYQ